MGAISFIVKGEGFEARKVFDRLVKDAKKEYGNNSYNGTISTCDLERITIFSSKYSKEIEEKAISQIKEWDYGEKWQARCLDLGLKQNATRKKVYLFYGWAAC